MINRISRISVIVPVYNTEKYLPRCVDSILAQTYTDFELLLIDDGSNDSSSAICDEYAQKDPRIKVFHKENGGVSFARNLGLDNAAGEYIILIDRIV
ncbi:MAG: glycosyltransferase [Alistipes sp.]|nr:glycosyltransferase [Alistipes sp.]